jgi:hypothetical protein
MRGDGEGEGDEGRQRYLKDDGDIEINSAPPASVGDADRSQGASKLQNNFPGFFLCSVRHYLWRRGIGALLVLTLIR